MRTVAIVQARMGSKRLPGKVLMPVLGRPMLQHLIERLQRASCLDDIVIATGDQRANQAIVQLARSLGIHWFVGSEGDVLGRYVAAARAFKAEVVVRVTADNPLTDPEVIEALVSVQDRTGADLVTPVRLVDGAESEITTLTALERSAGLSAELPAREHVTYFIKQHPELFRVETWEPPRFLRRPEYCIGVDTAEDMDRVRLIYQALYQPGKILPLKDVIRWLDENRGGAGVPGAEHLAKGS